MQPKQKIKILCSNKVYEDLLLYRCTAEIGAVWPDGKILLSIFTIYNNETLPKFINFVAKIGSSFCQILNKHSKNCQILVFFAKVVKFRQIWSHRISGRRNLNFCFWLGALKKPLQQRNFYQRLEEYYPKNSFKRKFYFLRMSSVGQWLWVTW